MAVANFKELYITEAQDLYSATTQEARFLDDLVDRASDPKLKETLGQVRAGAQQGAEAMARLVKGHEEDPTEEHCKGMAGLIREAKAHAIDGDFEDPALRDAMIITQVQRLEHYCLAGYGCLHAFAHRLGFEDDAKSLKTSLDGTYDSDRALTEIAMGRINKQAAA